MFWYLCLYIPFIYLENILCILFIYLIIGLGIVFILFFCVIKNEKTDDNKFGVF